VASTSSKKAKILGAFSGLEHNTIAHILYEVIKIALIAGAADIVIEKLKDKKERLTRKEKIENSTFEVLKEKVKAEDEAKKIAVKIANIGEEEIQIYICLQSTLKGKNTRHESIRKETKNDKKS
jgi:hypothetical protein